MKRKNEAVAADDSTAKPKRPPKKRFMMRGSLNTGFHLARLKQQGDNLEDIPTQMARFETLFKNGDTSDVNITALCA